MNIKKQLKILISSTFLKFLLVGGIGSVLNLFIFYILADVIRLNVSISAIIAFGFAVTQNYYFNSCYSFKNCQSSKFSLWSYIKYVCVNLLGLAVNLIVVNILVNLYIARPKVFAQFFGIAVGMVLNFIGSKYLVFKKPKY